MGHNRSMMNTSFDFRDKVALVTGASAGIGRATAMAFAASGALVVLADIDEARGTTVAAEIDAAGGRALFQRADLTLPADVDALFGLISDRCGRLDFAHNNVGAAWGSAVLETSIDEWDRTVDLCLKSAFLCMKQEIPLMREGGGGAIVNTASQAGVRYAALANSAYSAAKAGLIHLTAYVAMAHADDNIRANCVSPGLVSTELIKRFLSDEEQIEFARREQPIGRPLHPDEIAANVLWLCSDGAAMITGENLCVSGGGQV